MTAASLFENQLISMLHKTYEQHQEGDGVVQMF